MEAAGAKPGEAFLLAPRAGSSSADSLEVFTGRRLLTRKSGVGGLGHSSIFLKLPSRPLANSQVSASLVVASNSSEIMCSGKLPKIAQKFSASFNNLLKSSQILKTCYNTTVAALYAIPESSRKAPQL